MTSKDIVNLLSDEEEELDRKIVKLEKDIDVFSRQQKDQNAKPARPQKSQCLSRRPESEENGSSNVLSPGQSSSCILDHGQSPADDTGLSSGLPIYPPVSRKFWKAGSYNDVAVSRPSLQTESKNHLHVHPMFLHSNATSHKWAFGAIAELLDNAVDEIQNGATFVIVDKAFNPRDGSPALLIKDDGGGMDPEAVRRCMSFGFSDKKSESMIGQYGNGFKTSTMRLGADVIVFSRHLEDRILTQSIGLLSFTYLMRTGQDRIVVPMVFYKFDTSTGLLEALHGRENFLSNLSIILQWSPYTAEADLLKQFDDIGSHGTKVIVFNLWLNNDGSMELDFDADPKDIRIAQDAKINHSPATSNTVNDEHFANIYPFSLRAYLSILYLRLPESFRIVLRGSVVEHRNIANHLKFRELIEYRPQGVCAKVLTTVGFLKEAPNISIHGFNLYHKNRLILPFWKVAAANKGRGVVGILEANFIEPTHNKQEFERTSLFLKLEYRLKEMTTEYWNLHCGFIGYQVPQKAQAYISKCLQHGDKQSPLVVDQSSPAVAALIGDQTTYNSWSGSEQELTNKRTVHGFLTEADKLELISRRQTGRVDAMQRQDIQHENPARNQLNDPEAVKLLQINKKLREERSEYEKRIEELEEKAAELRDQIRTVSCQYSQLLSEITSQDSPKEEKNE